MKTTLDSNHTWFIPVMSRTQQLPREDFEGAIGLCRRCWEYTEVLKPCCGGEVQFDGKIYRPEDFEEK